MQAAALVEVSRKPTGVVPTLICVHGRHTYMSSTPWVSEPPGQVRPLRHRTDLAGPMDVGTAAKEMDASKSF